MLVMAAALIGLFSGGCATRRDVSDINQRLDRIEQQSAQTQRLVQRMDSVIAAGADADRKLRADLGSSVSDLQSQVSKLLENYNDLVQRIDALRRSQVIKLPPSSSPGADSVAAPSGASAECNKNYDSAYMLVTRGQYEKAITMFKSFMETCPNHADIARAHYWMGECYFSLQKFPDAVTQFEELLKNFKPTAQSGRAIYKLGRCKQELKQKAEAKALFERVIKDYPTTLEATQAKDRLKELK